MKVLWLVSMTLPVAAAACALPATDVSGGWLAGQLGALPQRPGAPELLVCSVDTRVDLPRYGSADGVEYALLPKGDVPNFTALLQARTPDLVHIWGSEYEAAAAMQRAAAALGLPVLVGIQGVMRDCAAHLCDGVPPQYLGSNRLQRLIDRVVPGALLDKNQQHFNELASSEAAMLGCARDVTGRTGYDHRAAMELAPNARYHRCNETLRPMFYTSEAWTPHNFGNAPTLLLSQGNYPLKNLHTVLKAMPAVLRRYPDATLKVAGWPPLEKGPLLQPVIDWMFPYQHYCKRLVKSLGLGRHLYYTGPLPADTMRQAFLAADVFLLPSYCENSPNSLGEAMLLGMPCVASNTGGIPDMLADGDEGILYGDAGNDDALAAAICRILDDPAKAAAYGAAAQTRARQTHNPAANADMLLGIYQTMLQGGDA